MTSEQRERLRVMAAERLAGLFSPSEAVSLAADLVAGGIDDPAVVALAILPADANQLRKDDVEPMFDELCSAVGVQVVSQSEAGWVCARSLATAIVDGDLAPSVGASRLWTESELVRWPKPFEMLKLSEEWQASTGAEREEIERRIIASAHSVVRHANLALSAKHRSTDSAIGTIRLDDVMPLLLEACPSFLSVWSEIEEEHRDEGTPGGRLYYLDASSFARHVVEMHQRNHGPWFQNVFDVIERMHQGGDEYVRELATIGYLEDIQNGAERAGIKLALFNEYLGPESLRWWEGLDAFWSGKSSRVVPVDRQQTLRHRLLGGLLWKNLSRSRSQR